MDTLLKHKETFNSFIATAKISPEETISNAYHFIKEISGEYYDNKKMNKHYGDLLSLLSYLEARCLGRKNMIDFSKKFYCKETPYISNMENIIDYIIWDGRRKLMGLNAENEEDLFDWKFQYRCVDASHVIYNLCLENGIKCRIVTIFPGFDNRGLVDSHISKHCFNIIDFKNKYYLVDITFAQFFTKMDNHIERLGVVGLEGPSVGCYMSLTEKGRKTAYKILTDGYTELTEEIFKIYMDSFSLSFRNGLFYDENDKCGISYTIDDYLGFLYSSDSQLKHEKIKCLGRQKNPLSNPTIDFKNLHYL